MTTWLDQRGALMSRYLDDVSAQPAQLRALVGRLAAHDAPLGEWAAAWHAADRPRLVLTGMGASLYAAEAVQAAMAHSGLEVQAVATSDLLDHEPIAIGSSFLVAISQSGESTEMKELLARVPADRLHVITNHRDSTLASGAGRVLDLGVREDRSVAIGTYTGSLAALILLWAAMRGKTAADAAMLLDAAAEIERMLPEWDRQAAVLADTLEGARSVSFIGWGGGAATAREAALLMKEGARTPGEGMGAAQFRHGAVEVVDERHALVIFVNSSGTGDREDRWAYLAEFAALPGMVIVIGATLPDRLAPSVQEVPTVDRGSPAGSIADIVPVQLLAAHLARLHGFESGEFRNTEPVIRNAPDPYRVPSVALQP